MAENFGEKLLDDGEKLVQGHTVWYIVGGLVTLALIVYLYTKNAGGSTATRSTGGGSFGGGGSTGIGTGSNTPVTTSDPYAQQVQDQLTLLQGTNAANQQNASFMQQLQESLATFTANLTSSQNKDILANYEEKAKFDTGNQVSLATALGNAQVQVLDATNQANERHTSALNAIADSQTVAAAEAQVQAEKDQFDYLFGSAFGTNAGAQGSQYSNGSVPQPTTNNATTRTSPLSWTQIQQNLRNGFSNGGSVASTPTNTNPFDGIGSSSPQSGAPNYVSNATPVITLPASFAGTRFGTIFNADQAQQLVQTANQEAIANNNVKNAVTANWEGSNAAAEHSNPLNNGQWFGQTLNTVANFFRPGSGSGSNDTLFSRIFGHAASNQPQYTPPFAPANNGVSTGNNTNWTGWISDITDPSGTYTGWYGNEA